MTDLDKLRDEKVVPAARAILAEMVEGLFPANPEDANSYTGLTLSVLQKMLDREMNITTEVPYMFQLLLSGLSGLNVTMHSLVLEPLDEARYVSLGKKILQILSDANVRLTGVKAEEVTKDFAKAKVKLQELFTAEKVTQLDLDYLTEKIFSGLKAVNDKAQESVESSVKRAEAKIFGIEDINDLTIGQVNEVLVNEVTLSLKPPAPPPGEVLPPSTPPSGDSASEPPTPV